MSKILSSIKQNKLAKFAARKIHRLHRRIAWTKFTESETVSSELIATKKALKKLKANLISTKKALSEIKAKYRQMSAAYHVLKVQQRHSRRLHPINVQLLFADAASQIGENLKSDCYVSLLPSALPAAFALREAFGGSVVCDAVENVDVDKHSLAPKWQPEVTRLVNHSARGALLDVDKIMTVGNALATTLSRFERPTLVLKNFREFHEPKRNTAIREQCGLSTGDTLLFASGNVVVGFEPVLRALDGLPKSYHLAALIRLKPAQYENEMLSLVKELGLEDRVHFFPFVEYDRLAELAAGADMGLITSDISNPNGAVGLPNRCFDYLTAGLPIVAPAMPDVKELVERYDFGCILRETTAEEWIESITRVSSDLKRYRENAVAARRILTWESQEDALYEFLGRPKSVTLLGFRDLTRYQRFIRLSRSLQKRGCTVKAAFYSRDPDLTNLLDGVEYFCTGHSTDGFGKLERLSRGGSVEEVGGAYAA